MVRRTVRDVDDDDLVFLDVIIICRGSLCSFFRRFFLFLFKYLFVFFFGFASMCDNVGLGLAECMLFIACLIDKMRKVGEDIRLDKSFQVGGYSILYSF